MGRKFGMAVAQMGPVHLKDTRATVIKRLIEMLREAKARGAQFVVFPELALTTFFPRYWIDDQKDASTCSTSPSTAGRSTTG